MMGLVRRAYNIRQSGFVLERGWGHTHLGMIRCGQVVTNDWHWWLKLCVSDSASGDAKGCREMECHRAFIGSGMFEGKDS